MEHYDKLKEMVAALEADFGDFYGDKMNKAAGRRIRKTMQEMKNLEVLKVTGNQLYGTLPTQLGTLRHLREVALDSNKFSGPLPMELGNLQKLTTLKLQHNLFNGVMPNQVCQLRENEQLEWLVADCDKAGGVVCADTCCHKCY